LLIRAQLNNLSNSLTPTLTHANSEVATICSADGCDSVRDAHQHDWLQRRLSGAAATDVVVFRSCK